MAPGVQPRYAVPASRGEEEPVTTGPGDHRAGQMDREQVIEVLKEAFVYGRLTKDDLDVRAGQALAARTYADLAMVIADLPVGPAQAPPTRRAARPPVNKETVKWALLGTGALIPPAMFVTAAFGEFSPLAFLAMPLLFIELIVAIIFVTVTLTSQRRDRSRASGGQLPPRPGPDGHALEAEHGGGTGDGPVPPGPRADQARVDLRADKSRRRVPARPVHRGAAESPSVPGVMVTAS